MINVKKEISCRKIITLNGDVLFNTPEKISIYQVEFLKRKGFKFNKRRSEIYFTDQQITIVYKLLNVVDCDYNLYQF